MKKIIATILFVFIFAVTLDAFAARTVCISQQTDTSLTFAFGDADGLSYGLFVAHGATDGGEDKFTAGPTKESYALSDALGLTAEAVADVALEVRDENDNDISGDFWLTVEGGKLNLSNGNPRPVGFIFICR